MARVAGAVFVALTPVCLAEERTWEVRGAFVTLKPGNGSIAIFLLPDKTRIEVPLAALSAADREVIRSATAATAEPGGGAIAVRGPMGKSVALDAPAILRSVETDAIWCHYAADAVLVYELYLADPGLSAAERSAAEKRLSHWRGWAAAGRVRLGDEWVLPAERAAIRRRADDAFRHAVQVLKLGNPKLAESEFEKASRIDPEDGRAEFGLGLAYAMTGPRMKPVEHFADAVRRAPEDAWALNNLAVAEFMAGRYGSLATRFRQVFDVMPTAQTVADNLGIMIATAGYARPKMPDRTVAELNELYRQVVQVLRLEPFKRPEPPPPSPLLPVFLSPYGQPWPAAAPLPTMLDPPAEWAAVGRTASGVVIAPGRVLTSRRAFGVADEIWVEDQTLPGRRMPATVMAALDDPPVALLRCDGLVAEALPMARKVPDEGVEVLAVNKPGGLLAGASAETGRGVIVRSGHEQLGGLLVHAIALTRGAGGGPIVDGSARVVGLVAATPRTDATGNARGLGLPVELVWPLLAEQLSELTAVESAEALSWDEVEAKAARSTVRVVVVEKRTPPPAK